MALVTSLGLHLPVGLRYAVQERLLPNDPSSESYTWHNDCDPDPTSQTDDDELLVTPRCVIWSRGGVFRKSYKFDLEKEEVSQALITSFPSAGPLLSRERKSEADVGDGTKSKAIVVFLKTQAHVYFLSGTSHVIHLPFEVETASAAPNGLILQRKLRVDNLVATSLKFPKVPPNSFVCSQPQPFSAASSQQSTFSIADLGAPKQLNLPQNSTLKDLWDPPVLADDSNWPRLFTLTDPLAEIGLVVQSGKADRRGPKGKAAKVQHLDSAEEILHVTRRNEFSQRDKDQPLVLALTLNKETSTYTVWKLAYTGQESGAKEQHRFPSGNASRRRSSFVPGSGTGATTPALPGQTMFRESFGGDVKPSRPKKASSREEDTTEAFASTLDPDYESSAVPRRKSRRVSSMLARADLSASHERSAFTELTGQANVSRRGESMGSQHARLSTGGHSHVAQSQAFNHSIGSFLEAPVDDLLDELRAGGDFEGFHNMGLEDDQFDALKQEMVLTKVGSVPAEHSNVRFSTQHIPARNQCKVFTLAAPSSAADERQSNTIVMCIIDPDEKRLLVLTLNTMGHKKTYLDAHEQLKGDKPEKNVTVVSLGGITRAQGVIDACRLDDGYLSRILVLTETSDGFGELSLQAPWSGLMKVPLPGVFSVGNSRSLGYNAMPTAQRERGSKKVLTYGPRALHGLQNSRPFGIVDLLDSEGKLHQLQIRMEPRNPHVRTILETCRAVLPGIRSGEGILVGWWNVMQWLRLESIDTVDVEWSALAIVLFALVLGLSDVKKSDGRGRSKPRRTRGHLRSSSGAQTDTEDWEKMRSHETFNGNQIPPWARNGGWEWLNHESDTATNNQDSESDIAIFDVPSGKDSFIQKHVRLARDFSISSLGQSAVLGYLPTSPAGNRSLDDRAAAVSDILVALHLLREEQKLDTTAADSFSIGIVSISPVLAQVSQWLGWKAWKEAYDVEDAALLALEYDPGPIVKTPIVEPFRYPNIYDWIQTCLITRSLAPFVTLAELVATRSLVPNKSIWELEHWARLTPRTLLFVKFFAAVQEGWSPVQFVEKLSEAGITSLILESLPEAILTPLREALVECQKEPPTTWSKNLLALVGREDVNLLLTPGQRPRNTHATLLAPSHESNIDVHSICSSLRDPESAASFDGSAEVDRQAITRAIFKDDRRVNEAINILNTFKPTIARVKADPNWTESELLEAQKEHAQMLAYRTLAIPSGRGLLYFSARIPLLTQRFTIGGFNLHCVMKPDNNTVGVEKNTFSEEKVCWAFFHSGVAAGLSISRDAKGIDTSWILYNKPAQDLSNRHAGFLLALGLNGHLKSVAKWVAFKYLTPKHTMTSIGLLLGLAASYIGTMDSLITRLLSVHVTRMLPPGAAELNLSPLTQTTGIMGIGLLYCNTQHRRMSEIMVSEIEHIDTETDEEPLRNEGYRLAAGFALGFINLGKGLDLKGLQDMRLTERLLTLAAGSKRVDLVHVLDKATAAAVVAIALIFMKSEDKVLARKIDVPDSVLQFDYVRPDIFLLRTLARHLIMWSHIEPSSAWVQQSLPEIYRNRSSLETIQYLTSEDLPFYDIVTGLCFAVALRYAGSGSITARDLLIHYLDQLMRICRIPADTFDKKLTRNTIRNCQDLLALAAATVMAGTGDIVVFRRLRSMHGRDDGLETPYGSHLAAHLAIGALFIGGGTHTFGTSNLAIASLLVAFYPIFPSSVQDNKSHLQAFRHFWVLAAEPRCLITRDIDTNQPVAVPISIRFRDGKQEQRNTPCLLPELEEIKDVRTESPEYWNVVLDLQDNETHVASFKATQTLYIRRRPVHDASTSIFQATLKALNETGTSSSLEWLFELPAFSTLTKAERALVLPPDNGGASDIHAGTGVTVVDVELVLEKATLESGKRDRLLGLKLLFEWADLAKSEGKDMQWIRREVVDRLKGKVWMASTDE
ncbi:hypothetical protein PVAG01_03183 [Phlyctema vagabunda]|uniref:Anaphase-promoting complex subunit 1 n=1 Tax=Phlyctema vagabunda TaxID=108571 RepID=A0ABR4PSS5_9HELO